MNEVQHRIRISDDTKVLLDTESSRTGHSYDTLIQLWGAAAGADPAAASKASAALRVQAATQDELRIGLAECAPNLRVAAIRLDDWHSSPESVVNGFGFSRSHAGADLTTTGTALWRSVRGHWVIGTRSNAIAAYRLGQFRGLYCGITWSASYEKRRYALTGYEIVGTDRTDWETDSVIGPASAEEIAAREYLKAHSLAMPSGAANPIANLFTV